MCHQTVGLVAGELERRGIATTSVSMLPDVSAKVRTPRVLEVPYDLGYPLGRPDDPDLQKAVMRAAFALLDDAGPPPVRRVFVPPAA